VVELENGVKDKEGEYAGDAEDCDVDEAPPWEGVPPQGALGLGSCNKSSSSTGSNSSMAVWNQTTASGRERRVPVGLPDVLCVYLSDYSV
jgi:hypothetical protein